MYCEIQKKILKFSTLNSLFNCYVRSKLEYCYLVWNPLYKNSIRAIDCVQSKFLRYCWYKFISREPLSYRYHLALNEFYLVSLEDRRKFYSCVFLFKIFNNCINDVNLLANINIRVPRNPNSRQKLLFSIPAAKSNYEFGTPFRRICSIYNDISSSLNEIDLFNDSLKVFKTKLFLFLHSQQSS